MWYTTNMNIRTIVIACVVAIFLVGGAWYFTQTPNERSAFANWQELSEEGPATGSGYGPTSTPHVTPPTTPPPVY